MKEGIVGLLVIEAALIASKLLGCVAWSWWWITAPLWVPLAVVAILVAFLSVIGGVIALMVTK